MTTTMESNLGIIAGISFGIAFFQVLLMPVFLMFLVCNAPNNVFYLPLNSSAHWDILGMLPVSLYHQQPIWDGVMILCHGYVFLLFPVGCSFWNGTILCSVTFNKYFHWTKCITWLLSRVLILASVCLQGIIWRSQRDEPDTKGKHLVSVFCMCALAKHFILEDFWLLFKEYFLLVITLKGKNTFQRNKIVLHLFLPECKYNSDLIYRSL